MDRRSIRNITTAVLVVVAAVGLAVAFLRTTSEVVVHSDPVQGVETATADTALVTSRTKQGGFRLLGITFTSPTYHIAVSFTAPPGCLAVLARSSDWPTGDEACGRPGPFTGEISGSGTAFGNTIVAVKFEVTEQCWESLKVADLWPGDDPACAP